MKGCGLHQKLFSVTESTGGEKYTYTAQVRLPRAPSTHRGPWGRQLRPRGAVGPAAAGPGRCPAACGGPRASSSACPTRRMRPTEPPSATSSGGAKSELLSASEHCSFLPKLELSYPLLHPKAPAKGLMTLTAWTSCAKRAGPGLTGQGCECRRRRRERPVCGAPHQLWVLACVLSRAGHAPVTSGRSRQSLIWVNRMPSAW